MKNVMFLLISGLVAISLTNCEKDNEDKFISENNQRIYFQYEYINFAWGYQHAGWLIDSSGNVYCYHKPENWYAQDSSGIISSAEMDSNILKADTICYKIDKNELTDKIGLIKKSSKGKVSEPVHEMCDAGVSVYSGYIYNEYTKTYKKVLLKQIGDSRIDNSARESVEIYEWLNSINYLIHNIE